jgi:hypothetical protein
MKRIGLHPSPMFPVFGERNSKGSVSTIGSAPGGIWRAHRHDRVMIPNLHISKLEASLYEARLSDGGVEISEPTLHATIEAALLFVGRDLPEDFAHFVDVHYGGVSAGTIGTARLVDEAESVADRLVELVAAVHRSEEALAGRRRTALAAALPWRTSMRASLQALIHQTCEGLRCVSSPERASVDRNQE